MSPPNDAPPPELPPQESSPLAAAPEQQGLSLGSLTAAVDRLPEAASRALSYMSEHLAPSLRTAQQAVDALVGTVILEQAAKAEPIKSILPEDMANVAPVRCSVDGQQLTVRQHGNREHRTYANGAEVLLETNNGHQLVRQQLEASPPAGTGSYWHRSAYTFEYGQPAQPGQTPPVTSITETVAASGEQANRMTVGDRLNSEMGGKIASLTAYSDGFAVTSDNGANQIVRVRGDSRTTFATRNGMASTEASRVLFDRERAPDGNGFLPAGSQLRERTLTNNGKPMGRGIDINLPDSDSVRESISYMQYGVGSMQLDGETFRSARAHTVTMGGQSHTEQNVRDWRRQPNGSILLYRRDPQQEASLVPFRVLRLDNGRLTASEPGPDDI